MLRISAQPECPNPGGSVLGGSEVITAEVSVDNCPPKSVPFGYQSYFVGGSRSPLAQSRRNREDLVFQGNIMRRWAVFLLTSLALTFGYAFAQQGERGQTSYLPVDITESFASLMARLSAEKPSVEQVHNALLNERYDLSDRPAQGVTMDRTKPAQEGVRVKLPAGVRWGKPRIDDPGPDPRTEFVSKRLLSIAASEAPGGRLCLSTLRDRRDQAAGWSRPEAVRRRF